LCAQCKAHVLISHRLGSLTQGDVVILDSDKNNIVRDNPADDTHIKELYTTYNSL